MTAPRHHRVAVRSFCRFYVCTLPPTVADGCTRSRRCVPARRACTVVWCQFSSRVARRRRCSLPPLRCPPRTTTHVLHHALRSPPGCSQFACRLPFAAAPRCSSCRYRACRTAPRVPLPPTLFPFARRRVLLLRLLPFQFPGCVTFVAPFHHRARARAPAAHARRARSRLPYVPDRFAAPAVVRPRSCRVTPAPPPARLLILLLRSVPTLRSRVRSCRVRMVAVRGRLPRRLLLCCTPRSRALPPRAPFCALLPRARTVPQVRLRFCVLPLLLPFYTFTFVLPF